jgi:type II restriction/modification system DNA methylase subunit YeeA
MELYTRWHTLRVEWQVLTDETQRLEVENNRVFIDAYGLQEELGPEVPLEEITLTCNPYYRYSGNYTDAEREARLLQDTMQEFLSYAVGCMFGRYSLDKPGLILANQGETLRDYLKIIGKEPIFRPTETNVIPILDGDWFADDVVLRFKEFLKVTFGEPNYEENLRFIEQALGKDLRKYFLRDFYRNHVQMYKKRPIYWLFSSPKGSFNALIYMHRYQPDTVSVVLNQYLREYREKLDAQRRFLENVSASPVSSAREKTSALKEVENLTRIQSELKAYEDNVLFPLAGQRISIDLDDGVLVNYAKFGEALRKI